MRRFIYISLLIIFIVGCQPKSKLIIDGTHPVYPPFIDKDVKLEEIFASNRLFEAPVWDPIHHQLYFTGYEKGSEMLMRFIKVGEAEDVDLTKGTGGTYMTPDQKNMVTANGELHQVIQFEMTSNGVKNPKVLAYNAEWFQPNDLVMTLKGNIYITDPDFKTKKNGAVYFLNKNNELKKMNTNLPVPNGIIASPKGDQIYVSDSSLKEWWVFKVQSDGNLAEGKMFFKPNSKSKNSVDGMTVDEKGNIYATGYGGVWIINQKGLAIGFIPIPEFCTNIAFGDAEYKTLYISCYKKMYRIKTNMRGFMPKLK